MKKIAYIMAAVLIVVLLIFAGYGGVLGCACLASLLFHFWPDFVFLSIVYWISILVLLVIAGCWIAFTEDDEDED